MKEKKSFFRRFLRFIRWLLKVFYDSDEFLYLQRPLKKDHPENASFNFDFRFGGKEDLPDLGVLCPPKKELFAARLQAGHDVLCIYKEGSLVGYMWIATNPYHEPQQNLHVPITDKDVYLFDSFVIPAARQQGSHYPAQVFFDSYYLSLGRSRNLSIIRNDPTIPSYHVHKKFGFKPLSRIRYRRILWIKRCRFLPFEGTF